MTDSGGWKIQEAIVKQQFPHVAFFSTYRPGSITVSGNVSLHASGHAVDMTPSMDIFNWIRANFKAQTNELIYTPAGNNQIKNGQDYKYTGAVAAQHFTHVHWGVLNPESLHAGGVASPGGPTTISVDLPNPVTAVSDVSSFIASVNTFFKQKHGGRRVMYVVVGLIFFGVGARMSIGTKVDEFAKPIVKAVL